MRMILLGLSQDLRLELEETLPRPLLLISVLAAGIFTARASVGTEMKLFSIAKPRGYTP